MQISSEKERQQSGVFDACGCLWVYLADLRASEGSFHTHCNFFYDPLKHEGPLLPPAAALAPTLWPQFHLRWACPSEAQAGELEAQCRIMVKQFNEMQKAKEFAERKAKDITTSMELLTAELQRERQLSSSTMDMAKRAFKESASIKRAIQSLGCKVHLSSNGECALDFGSNPLEVQQKFICSPSQRNSGGNNGQWEEKSDLSVSISVMEDDAVPNSPISRPCETFCPLRSRDGSCNWPNAGCAQLGSQFIGLKANFDAFDKLSIYDCYFGSE
ncbi:Myotubularin phosphatase domain [Macleaya cordata]|uniref:Myotubularin phosphatase domain n=1 Tax=Macleaya cordata TaxID=56857 RepID=A0A200R9Q3_MACCD|nr:Myotubularin phosphatase domain [Macleaya cordata]